jgi:chemotaxis protein MotB
MSHGGGGGDRWLVSYADFITLLMVLFVVLYSMGQVDVEKYKMLAENLRSAFAGGGPVKVVSTNISSGGGTSKDGAPNPIVVPGIPQKPPVSEEVAGDLANMLASSNLGSEVSVQTSIDGVLISLSEKMLFPQDSAALQDSAFPVLDTIIGMLKTTENQIKIVGHTDDTQPTVAKYENNWELSLARAMMIGDYMVQSGINPKRLIITGRGEYDPIFPNDTTEHRALNSRADIVVVYQVDSNLITSGSRLSAP